jgi:adenosylhomocysteinase
MLIDAFE